MTLSEPQKYYFQQEWETVFRLKISKVVTGKICRK